MEMACKNNNEHIDEWNDGEKDVKATKNDGNSPAPRP